MITTLLLVLGGLSVLGIVLIILMKTGTIKDKDNDLIPDNLEDLYSEVESRVDEVKAEYQDVKLAIKDLKKQLNHIQEAVQGQKRRGRKPKTK